MTGKGHIVSGSIFMADTFVCRILLRQIDMSASFYNFFEVFEYHFNPLIFYQDCDDITKYLFLGLCILFYYFGLLLPDIDTTSTISNFFHFKIPGPHRGFTHSLWLVLLFLIPGFLFFKPICFLALGMLIHDISDSLSSAGWVPFYPFGNYKLIHENIVCSKCKHITLYSSTAKHSETACNIILFLTSALIFIGILLARFYLNG